MRYLSGLIILAIVLAALPQPVAAAGDLPPIVFVARGQLATRDHIFPNDLSPPTGLLVGMSKFAPASRLLRREPDGSVHVLVDTGKPSGHPLNPLGLRDLQAPDVSFDGTRIVFAGSTGPQLYRNRMGRLFFNWRLYELGADGILRQLTQTDRPIRIPGVDEQDRLGNDAAYSFYDDMFPAYLADGRIVFSSSRYPSRAPYDGRPAYNLYILDPQRGTLMRITTERSAALHPAPLPDGRIVFSHWWINFNQPSDTGLYNRIDNRRGDTTLSGRSGHYLPDGTFVLENVVRAFEPARAILPDGTTVRDAPDTWHLMVINPDGTGLQRFAWTPRYAVNLTDDDGQDTFNAAQPAPFFWNGQLLTAYTTQRDTSMAHTTFYTGIRVAYPGIERMALNTRESIAGYRWDQPKVAVPPYAISPAGLPDGRIIFSQSFSDPKAPTRGTYTFTRDGRRFTVPLQGDTLRYRLWVVRADGSGAAAVPMNAALGSANLFDAVPMVARIVGSGRGEWRMPEYRFTEAPADDPLRWNVPQGLKTSDGRPAYPWSERQIGDIQLVKLHNPNVYANPPLELPFVNNSPPVGSVAYAEIYLDAGQFSGARIGAQFPDEQVRAVKWLTVPVSPQGEFVASVPADVPNFIVLRDAQGRIVRGGNRSSLSIAQGNAPGRAGESITCIGCHMGHVSGSITQPDLAAQGWTNIAPAATVTVSSGNGSAARLTDRRGYVPAVWEDGGYQDRSGPWMASGERGAGEMAELRWPMPMSIREVRLIGAEPGQAGFSGDYRVSGQLRFFLGATEIEAARTGMVLVEPLTRGGSALTLTAPVIADRVLFTVAAVEGQFNNRRAPAALSEIEVSGRSALVGSGTRPEPRDYLVRLPLVGQ